jgi:hypothetical protein
MSHEDNQTTQEERSPCKNEINEKQLTAYCKAGIVRELRLVGLPDGEKFMYRIKVCGNWAASEQLLITFRKDPREWKSLDRVVHHVRDAYGYTGRINLDFEKLERLDE